MAGLDSGPILGALIRDLLADEPADRPTAREVRERLAAAGVLGRRRPIRLVRGDRRLVQDRTDGRGRLSPNFPPAEAWVGSESAHAVLEAGAARLGRYRLLDKLGEGGQGIVYRAEDPAEGTIVAIKVLRSERAGDAMGLRRFRKEARLQAAANNPHVVNLLEYNEEDGVPYLVLEFVAGEGLDRLLRRRGRLDEREALAIMAEVARGLMAAHERGIVHRDIKPSNILLLPRRRRPALAETLHFVTEIPPTEASSRRQIGVPATVIMEPRNRGRPRRQGRPRRGSRSPTSGWPGTSSTPNPWP